MVGLMQIMIYLFCIYLVFKGVEIFQIAFTSKPENPKSRQVGIVFGILAIVAAVFIAIGAFVMTEEMAAKINNNMQNLQNFGR